MNYDEDRFLVQNKYIEDKLDELSHTIDSRLDKLFRQNDDAGNTLSYYESNRSSSSNDHSQKYLNPYSSQTLASFKAPYIRDFRNFSAPVNSDVRQIQQLNGAENINHLVKNKIWSRENKQHLAEIVLDYYSKLHIIQLIKQKNQLLNSPSKQNDEDVSQKLQLIDEQTEQVKARNQPRIFVPEDRNCKQIDWCAISAKLTTSHHDARDCRLMWSNELHWSINNDEWTKDEDICLINAVAKHGTNDWDRVSRELNSGRLAWQCCARYSREYAYVPLSFDKDESIKIIEIVNLCRIGKYVPWNQVMYFIQHHNLAQIKYQWHKHCSDERNAANWTPSEDYLLLRAIEKYGERDWCRIAESVPGRTNKSCRERYKMRLKYQFRDLGAWLKTEDIKLLSLLRDFGTNWSIISSHFPGRNSHQLRNRYELLRVQVSRAGPVKHKRLYRNNRGEFVETVVRRKKPTSEVEINEKLRQIFSTYFSVKKGNTKTLTCRSAQDEVIYQTLICVLRDMLVECNKQVPLLNHIINRAVNPMNGLLMPCIPTIRAYRAWSLQQDYLNQFRLESNCDEEPEIDPHVLRVVVGLFLWPAILSRLKPPEVDPTAYHVGSMIERESRNLYKIRDIQRQITK